MTRWSWGGGCATTAASVAGVAFATPIVDEGFSPANRNVSLTDRSDTYHPLFKRLFADPPRLVTTTLLVAEGHGRFLKRYDRIRALHFIALIEELSPMSVIAVGPDEQAGGVRTLRSSQIKISR